MSAPIGSAASSSIDEPQPEPTSAESRPTAATNVRPRSGYLHDLASRRTAALIRQQTAYGLVLGWVLTLVGGFVYCCVPSRVDWLWLGMLILGLGHLAAAVVLPQSLAWPERLWKRVARIQGWAVMTALLTIIYFCLIWPASYFSRRRYRGFIAWEEQPPPEATAWEAIEPVDVAFAIAGSSRRRSLPLLLLGVIAFFIRRGNYAVVAIVVLLLVLGLVLYFVQSSALAPFIYTLF